jgi:(2Fe-2S) ferredoxin
VATLAKPGAKVRDYDAHVLVCKGSDCKKRGSKTVRGALKSELRAQGMNRDVRVDAVDCLGLCKHGPNLVIYPGGTWYLGVTERDMSEVVGRHLKDGEPVENLAATFRTRRGSKGR